MMQKRILVTFSILCLLMFTTNSFAKKLEKDESVKKQTVKVAKKEQAIQKTGSNSKDNSIKPETSAVTTPRENDTRIQTNFPPMTSPALTGEQINWQVISSGGVRGTSTNFILSSTIGQTAVGMGSSTNFKLNSGFWQTFGTQSCCIGPIRGDFDLSSAIDISDLVSLVSFMFSGGAASDCFEEADINGSGGIDISDLVSLVSFMFSGGAAPANCP